MISVADWCRALAQMDDDEKSETIDVMWEAFALWGVW